MSLPPNRPASAARCQLSELSYCTTACLQLLMGDTDEFPSKNSLCPNHTEYKRYARLTCTALQQVKDQIETPIFIDRPDAALNQPTPDQLAQEPESLQQEAIETLHHIAAKATTAVRRVGLREAAPLTKPSDAATQTKPIGFSWLELPTEGGPFLYHLHDQPFPEDGNCSATLAHLNPFKRGESVPCDPTAPQTCQVGDLSGKHAHITSESFNATYTHNYVSLDDGAVAFFGNRSFVLHFGNKTRITCANFERVDLDRCTSAKSVPLIPASDQGTASNDGDGSGDKVTANDASQPRKPSAVPAAANASVSTLALEAGAAACAVML